MQKKLYFFYEQVAFSLLFIISNNRIVLTTSLEENVFIKTIAEMMWWFLIILLILKIENNNHLLEKIWGAWKVNWPLVIFIGVAILSIFWTENLPATLYKVLVLIASSFVATYIGIIVGTEKFLKYLAWFFGIVAIVCVILSLYLPQYGIQPESYHHGAWRGIFGHKNFMGSFMAVGNLIFLFLMVINFKHIKEFILYTAFYLLTLSLVILSKCATAEITLSLIHIIFVCALIWLKIKHRFKRQHYLIILLIFTLIVFIAFINLDTLFGLFNRTTSLTGRIPLWSYLINIGQTNHPVTGFGFGATWDHDNFRAQIAQSVGYQVLNSDNGYVEIFLHLGLLGFIPFIFLIGIAIWRTIKNVVHSQTLISFLPLLITLTILLINIPLSYFLEIESFFWILLIYAMVAATPFHWEKKEPQ